LFFFFFWGRLHDITSVMVIQHATFGIYNTTSTCWPTHPICTGVQYSLSSPPYSSYNHSFKAMTYCISGSPSLIIWMKTFARCKGNHLDTLPYLPCRQHWTKSHSRPLQPYDYLAPRYSCESPNGIVVTTETEGKKAVQTHLLMVPHHPSCQPIPKQWGIEPHALPNTPVCPGTFRLV